MTRWEWKEVGPNVYVAGSKDLHGSLWAEFGRDGIVRIGWDVTAKGWTVGAGWVDVRSRSRGGIRRATQAAMQRAAHFAYGYQAGLRSATK